MCFRLVLDVNCKPLTNTLLHYILCRYYVISRIPKLEVLDYTTVTADERSEAIRIYGASAPVGVLPTVSFISIVIHSFYMVLFSALKQTHCAHWHVILNECPYPFIARIINIHGSGVFIVLFGCCMVGAT